MVGLYSTCVNRVKCSTTNWRYSETGDIKNRHESYSPSKREAWKLPSSKRPLKYCSPHTGAAHITCVTNALQVSFL